jgi:thioredoxin 1
MSDDSVPPPAEAPPTESAQGDSKNAAPVIVINDDNFAEEVLSSLTPVLVDFGMPRCYGCLCMSPLMDQIAIEFAGRVKVCKMDISQNRDTYEALGIMAMPTLILFKGGQEALRIVGYDPTLRQTLPLTIASHLDPTVAVNDDNFEAEVLKSTLPVLVDFGSPHCYPCRMMEPVVNRLAREFAGRLKVCKMNVALKSNKAFKNYELLAVPTLILFKDGKEVWRQRGFDPDFPTALAEIINGQPSAE